MPAFSEKMPHPYGACENLRVNISSLTSEETYNPFQAAADIYTGFKLVFQCWRLINQTSDPFHFINNFAKVGSFTWNDASTFALMTIMWALARYCLDHFICGPFSRVWKMSNTSAKKFSESVFKTLAFLFLWLAAVYVTFFRDHDFFNKSLSLWEGCEFKFGPSPLDLRLVYGLEASFYFFSIFATFLLDTWRRDSIAMILHHIVTLILVGFAYSVRYLKIGILIFVLNDFSDVLLELGKCCIYLRVPGSRFANFWNNLSKVSSSIFAVSWLVCRNCFHLTKVWRSAAFGTWISAPYLPTPFHFFFNSLLGVLYLFYIYWACYIIFFIFKIYSGQMKEVDDIRDDDVQETQDAKKPVVAAAHHTNGIAENGGKKTQ